MEWTEQQKEAIEAPVDNILVSAAAGSGKTAVLTERIKRLVVEKRIPVENMLVVTFTNAAASEMREKIINALKEAEETARKDHKWETVDFVRTQLRTIPSANISTFHKFLIGVIRQYFFLTDIDQDFAVCDDAQKAVIMSRCIDDMFEDRLAAGDENFRRFLDAYSDIKSLDKVRNMIRSVYSFIMNMEDPLGWLDKNVEKLNCTGEELENSDITALCRKAAVEQLESAVRIGDELLGLMGEYPTLDQPDKKGSLTIYMKVASNVDAVRSALENAERMGIDELRESLEIDWKDLRTKKNEKPVWNEIKGRASKLHNDMKDCVKEAAKLLPVMSSAESAEKISSTYPYALTLADLVRDFDSRFSAAKRARKYVDYSDIEHVAYSILTDPDHPEVLEAYRDRFDVIFIDEYQDSSRIQEAIIRSVSRGRNVYMVGDVKQSIYKFRQADPDIFIGKYNSFTDDGKEAEGRRIDLNMNFRSKGGIIDAVNGVFRNIMTMEKTGIAYDEAAELHKGSAYEAGGELDYGASLHLVEPLKIDGAENLGEELENLTAAETEGRMIAELVDQRMGKPIFDDKKNAVRNAGPDDIVILLRSRTNADVYAKALRDKGIPAYVHGGEGYFETYEIEMFMNLLRVIDNRRRDLELISVLRSPVKGFGFSIDELARIRLLDSKISYSEAFSQMASGSTRLSLKCRAAEQQLEDWRVEARFTPLPEFIWNLMVRSDLLSYTAALPGGARRAANLRLLVDKAEKFTREQGEGLFSFVNYIERIKESGGRKDAQASFGGDISDMVQIMTIHKSKGLEFPIVFVSNLSSAIKHDKDNVNMQLHKNLGIALCCFDTEAHTSLIPVNYSTIRSVKNREDFEEEKRNLYVAMTRAKDELILTAGLKNLDGKENDMLKIRDTGIQSDSDRLLWVWANAEEAKIKVERHDPGEYLEDNQKKREDLKNIRESIINGFPDFKDEEGLVNIIQDRFEYRYPYMRESEARSKFTVTGINKMLRGESADLFPKMVPSIVDGELPEVDLAAEKYEESESDETAVNEKQQPDDASGDGDVPQFLRGTEKVTPARRGTLTHKVLELIDYSEENDIDRVKAFTEGLVEKGIMSKEEAAAVSYKDIASFFSSDLGKRACRASKRRNEWAFTLKKNTEELAAEAADPEIRRAVREELPEQILIQGVIDCAFRDDDGIVVVDFKTDRYSAADEKEGFRRFVDRYRRQLDLYCEVVEKEYGEPVARASLFMLRAGREVVVR